MRLKFKDGWLDYDLNLFLDIAHPIDEKVHSLFEVVKTDFEVADTFDYPLTIDHLLGVGLVAAQVYLVSAAREQGAPKLDALAIGPRHRSGATVVQLVNHGANFWKHADEWDFDSPDRRQQLILSAFSDLGIKEDHWHLIELVMRITDASEPRLADLAPFLEEWRNALDEAFPRAERRGDLTAESNTSRPDA